MTAIHELSGFQNDLLFVIAGLDGPNGQEIKRELESSYSGAIQHGRLYDNLNDLVEMELVEKGSRDGRTNQYELTREGWATIEARHDWEAAYLGGEN
jgi:DNA-binding PadR family transcriptional regulator